MMTLPSWESRSSAVPRYLWALIVCMPLLVACSNEPSSAGGREPAVNVSTSLVTLERLPVGWRLGESNYNYFGARCDGHSLYLDYRPTREIGFVRGPMGEMTFAAHRIYEGDDAATVERILLRRLENCDGQTDQIAQIVSNTRVPTRVEQISLGPSMPAGGRAYRIASEVSTSGGDTYPLVNYFFIVSDGRATISMVEMLVMNRQSEQRAAEDFRDLVLASISANQ